MAIEVCPVCGSVRTGSFRFCRSCGLDFDADAQAGPTADILAPAGVSGIGASAATLTAPAPAATSPATTSPASSAAVTAPGRPSADVIVIKVRHLRLALGVLVGALVGAMLAGAVVVPAFGETVTAGAVAGAITIVLCAWLGLRIAMGTPTR